MGLAKPPYGVVTAIPFKVGYLVESSNPLEAYVGLLERNILEAAAAGALQCNMGGPLFGRTRSATSLNVISQSVTTVKTGEPCQPQISECTFLETSFDMLVADNVDPDVSAFLGYVLMRAEMEEGDLVRNIPMMDRIVYQSPLPLLPPLGDDGLSDQSIQAGEESIDQINVSPWTLGAVVTMGKSWDRLPARPLMSRDASHFSYVLPVSAAAGVIALGAWLRNRRNRNQRHQHLIEEMSGESAVPSTRM